MLLVESSLLWIRRLNLLGGGVIGMTWEEKAEKSLTLFSTYLFGIMLQE